MGGGGGGGGGGAPARKKIFSGGGAARPTVKDINVFVGGWLTYTVIQKQRMQSQSIYTTVTQ